VFYEKFPVSMGSMQIECYRSPRKEARILDLVKGDMRFMQGYSRDDAAGNNVRVSTWSGATFSPAHRSPGGRPQNLLFRDAS
jgi:hypothetical protein